MFSCHGHTCHSNYRLRDSIIRVPDFITRHKELGFSGCVLTEHESLGSHLEAEKFFEKIKDTPEYKGFKLAFGNEIYLCPDYVTAENVGHNIYPHFILIALDALGHKALRELSTIAWTKNSFYSMMYRVPTYYSDLEEILDKYKGHLIGSSACLGGSIPRKLLEYRSIENIDIIQAEILWKQIKEWIEYMVEIFGEGYFFLEMQPNSHEDQIYVNKCLYKLSQETNVPFIITFDEHYLKKEDRDIHRAYLKSSDGDREVDEFYTSTYIMTEEEVHEYMDDYLGADVVQQGMDNTMLIYDKVQYYSLKKELQIPYLPFDLSEPDEDLFNKYKDKIELLDYFYHSEYPSDRHMTRELLKSLEKNTHYQCQRGYDAIQECLSSIKISSEANKVRWSAYLMQVRDYVNIAWESDSIVAPSRGSGGGFCLLYLLDIIQLDPLRENTKMYPWRFLNPERVSVLDIDTDVEAAKRESIIRKIKETYGYDRVSKVCTLQTEKSRSAILTAARALDIDNDTASYIASLVVFDRGQPRDLHTMYYGNDDYAPVLEFVREMDARPELWEVSQKIEGLISGIGSHAGGVIIDDKPLIESTALMRTNSGDIITQFNLHDCEDAGLIKIDLLATDALNFIHATLNLLLKNHEIEWQSNLKDTYDKYLGIYNIDRTAPKMWNMVANHKIINLFQMEKQSGRQALALVKPHSVDDLATINSVIRLMAQDKGAETPLEKYARFHDNIQLWYDEMTEYGLTDEEQDILKDILGISCGICEAQEYLILLTMHPKIGGFSLKWADQLRKAVAKKSPKDFDKLEKEFFQNMKDKNLSENLCKYVWYVLIYTQRGYGFNKAHTLAYSCIGVQEAYLNYKYNPIYWQTANLIVNSGSYDEDSNESTNYDKIGVAIATIQMDGVKVEHPLINEAQFEFTPDIKNNQIMFGLKGINGVNTDIAQSIIQNRPFQSIEDFATRMIDTKIIKNSQMVKLIKGGCFTGIDSEDKTKTMKWYLSKYCINPVTSLTLSQFNRMIEYNIIPNELALAVKMVNFKKYVLDDEGLYEKWIDTSKSRIPKRGYHDGHYILDEPSQEFFKQHFTEESIVDVVGGFYVLSEKKFIKEIDKKIEPLREWFNSEEAIQVYNQTLFNEVWNKYADGTPEAWSMEALTYYDGDHELKNVPESLYGIVNFFELPEEPVAYEFYTRYIDGKPKAIPKYNISRIAGTVVQTDNNHHSIALVTTHGLVNIKFSKGHYAFYNKRISQIGENGKKTTIEDSWLKRGNKLLVSGYRRGEQFIPWTYNDTIYRHRINLIENINEDGTLKLKAERAKV